MFENHTIISISWNNIGEKQKNHHDEGMVDIFLAYGDHDFWHDHGMIMFLLMFSSELTILTDKFFSIF